MVKRKWFPGGSFLMNNVILIGRLSREPELRYLPSGDNAAVVRFTLAVDRSLSKEKRAEAERNNQPTADFISCTAWRNQATFIGQYIKKGDLIAISGRIQTSVYKKHEETIFNTSVNVEEVKGLESS